MAGGGSFASDPSFDAYNQQVSPAMASYFQTMGQLERSRGRLMEVSQGIMGAVPGAMNLAQSGLMRANSGMGFIGAGASAFHGQFVGGYNRYQGPVTGQHDFMGPGTAIAGLMGGQPFIQGRHQYEGSHIARDVALQNFNIGAQDAARTLLTDVGPQAAMMMGFAMGGPWGGAVAGAGVAASLTAPMALRKFGVDAQLHSERFRRQIQMSIGERLGDRGGANRFRLSRDAAANASGAITDYVSDVQKQYGWFAPEAKEFEPLVQAAIATTSDKDLPKILEKGAKGLKDRISALRNAAAVLNTNFEEIAQLATEFGEDSETGVGGRFGTFVSDLNKAATRGRGLNRRALGSAAIQAREQALSQGFQGETTQRGFMTLAADIQQRANIGAISRDYLFAFGGKTQSEAAINTAMATQQMERNLAGGPFGLMALARMRGGGGIQGGLLGGAQQLGQEVVRDPFGFMLAQYSPQNITRMGQESKYQLFSRMQQTFGGSQLGQLATLRALEQTGLNKPQAMGQYRQIRGERRILESTFKDSGLSTDQLMNAYLTAKGTTPDLTLREFTEGGFSTEQLKDLAGGDSSASMYLGAGRTKTPGAMEWMTDEEITEAAIQAESLYTGERLKKGTDRSLDVVSWDWIDTASVALAIPTFGMSLSMIPARRAVAAGLPYFAEGIQQTYEAFSGDSRDRVEETVKSLKAEREEKKEEYAQAYGYAGTTSYLRSNIESLKHIGVIQEDLGSQVGLAGQFLAGLYGNTEKSKEARDQILTYLEGTDPKKAAAFRTLSEKMIVTEVDGKTGLRLPAFQKGADKEVFEAMEQLSAENLAEALTAAGKEGALTDFKALQAAFESNAGVSVKELKDENVRKQAQEFTKHVFNPTSETTMLLQQRYFSAFSAGSLAQQFAQAAAGIERTAYANLAKLSVEGGAVLTRT